MNGGPVREGDCIGHYSIQSKLGEGGMGVVWQALDTRLDRKVAIKALPEGIQSDADRVERFNREARLLASLNHPHIAGIHGLEEAGDRRYLVMELVEGADLAHRLQEGPLNSEDAVDIAVQVADALEAAHENGIIHRDLKPANIQITSQGQAKVLDFGLAKAFDVDALSAGNSLSPTLTTPATQAGMILGTAAYMSPEQAKGREADRRTDIWAFGCVLFEMLTGRRAFHGEAISEVLAGVLRDEPEWSALPAEVPPRLQQLLRRCLRKDARLRLRDIGDARVELEEIRAGGEEPIQDSPQRRSLPWTLLIAVAALSMVAGTFLLSPFLAGGPVGEGQLSTTSPVSLSVIFPEHQPMNLTGRNIYTQKGFALSPDGRSMVYVSPVDLTQSNRKDTYDDLSRDHLLMRRFDSFQVEVLLGTEGAGNPVFSPDGRFLAYTAAGRLWKIAVTGGAPVPLATTSGTMGLDWGVGDTLVYAQGASGGIWAVSAAGGDDRQVSFPDMESGEVSHRWPQILPGGTHALITVKQQDIRSFDDASLQVVSLETGEAREILQGGTCGRYVDSGHVIYGRDGNLYALPFDLDSLQPSGTPFLAVQGVLTSPPNGMAQFDVSRAGHLAFVEGGSFSTDARYVMMDREGNRSPLPLPPDNYQVGIIAPDATRLVVPIATANDRLWIYDFRLETLTPLTEGIANDISPVWTPDGSSIIFGNDRTGYYNLYIIDVDGGTPMRLLRQADINEHAGSVSADGRWLSFDTWDEKTGQDIWILPLEAEGEAVPFLQTVHNESGGVFSPNGDWMAYDSDESGESEVYIQRYPGPGGRFRVSPRGGWSPQFGADGREIIYQNGNRFFSVAITWKPEFAMSKPKLLFDYESLFAETVESSILNRGYSLAPDGQSILLMEVDQDLGIRDRLSVVLNWRQHLASQ